MLKAVGKLGGGVGSRVGVGVGREVGLGVGAAVGEALVALERVGIGFGEGLDTATMSGLEVAPATGCDEGRPHPRDGDRADDQAGREQRPPDRSLPARAGTQVGTTDRAARLLWRQHRRPRRAPVSRVVFGHACESIERAMSRSALRSRRRRSTIGCHDDRLVADPRKPTRAIDRARLCAGRDRATYPRVGRAIRGAPRSVPAHGRAGLPRRTHLERLGRRRHGLRQPRHPVRGAGARRLGLPGRAQRPYRAPLADACRRRSARSWPRSR